MSNKSVATSKPITVSIAGKKYELEATLDAIRKINQSLDGVLPAYRGFNNRNIDTTAVLIIAGAGLSFEKQKAADKFVMAVFREPVESYSKGLNEYLNLLMSGGNTAENDHDDEVDVDGELGNA